MPILKKLEENATVERSAQGFASDLPLSSLASLVLLGEDHSGRDEMNLAGNPIGLLQPSKKSTQNVISREWERKLNDGRTVTARWEVAGHPKLGLPGPSEDLLLLMLLQLTREAADENGGEYPRVVHFSRYGLISRLGWPDSGKSYKALADGLTRLTGVTISTRYAFYDAKSKLPIADQNFHLLENSSIVDEPRGRKGETQLPLSWFSWSETMHESIIAGNVRSLALQFVRALELPLSRKLFRFLDSMRWAQKPPRREFAIGIMNLRDRVGMTPYEYVSKVKEKFAGAHQELLDCGYLDDVNYMKGVSGDMLVCYKFGTPRPEIAVPTPASAPSTPENLKQKREVEVEMPAPPPVVPLVPRDPVVETAARRLRSIVDVFLELPPESQDSLRKWAVGELDGFVKDRYIRNINNRVPLGNEDWFSVRRKWREHLIEGVWNQYQSLCETRLARFRDGEDTFIDDVEIGLIPVPEVDGEKS
ncbi:hypothetical protein EON83_11275 [bacterium]|nr:MAG: hypothetical protein EON83_11275 [bacterium]